MFDLSLYNDDFFLWHLKYAREYSIKTMDWYIDNFKPNSVVDFGCGIASYLESAYQKGITDIKGFDIGGEYARKYTPNFLSEFVTYQDCTEPINCGNFDCVISFETAEHIEPSGTDTFVNNITNAVNPEGFILFTAAPPGQDGCGHINMYPKEWWISKFLENGVEVNQEMTEKVKTNWDNLNVGCPRYILDNLIIFNVQKPK